MWFLCTRRMGKLCVCIDFRNLNKATPMDGYPMPVADMLVDAAVGHKVINFIDGNLDIIRYSWLRKIFIKLHLDVQGMLVCLSGLS